MVEKPSLRQQIAQVTTIPATLVTYTDGLKKVASVALNIFEIIGQMFKTTILAPLASMFSAFKGLVSGLGIVKTVDDWTSPNGGFWPTVSKTFFTIGDCAAALKFFSLFIPKLDIVNQTVGRVPLLNTIALGATGAGAICSIIHDSIQFHCASKGIERLTAKTNLDVFRTALGNSDAPGAIAAATAILYAIDAYKTQKGTSPEIEAKLELWKYRLDLLQVAGGLDRLVNEMMSVEKPPHKFHEGKGDKLGREFEKAKTKKEVLDAWKKWNAEQTGEGILRLQRHYSEKIRILKSDRKKNAKEIDKKQKRLATLSSGRMADIGTLYRAKKIEQKWSEHRGKYLNALSYNTLLNTLEGKKIILAQKADARQTELENLKRNKKRHFLSLLSNIGLLASVAMGAIALVFAVFIGPQALLTIAVTAIGLGVALVSNSIGLGNFLAKKLWWKPLPVIGIRKAAEEKLLSRAAAAAAA